MKYMKTKFYIGIILFLAVMQACDVTDRIPESMITDLNYWTKVEDLKLYSRSFYTTLTVPETGYPDVQSDICVPSQKNSTLFDNRTVPTGSDGWSSGDWGNIRACNYFMTHYQTVQGDQTDINHYVGEIRFFRAREYFNKVKRFGDVPWYDVDLQTNDTELLYKGRDPRLSVVNHIIDDLKFAATNMKEPSLVSKGQLHKYVAYALLARVCLYEGTWMKYRGITGWETLLKEAANAAETIIDSGLYDIVKQNATYTMDKDHPLYYKSLFIQEDLVDNKECILPRIYLPDVLTHGISRPTSDGLSKDFIESFLCKDGKPIALSDLYQGDASISLEMQNRDPRMYNLLDCCYNPSDLNIDGSPKANEFIIPFTSDPKCATGYRSIKYRHPDPQQQVYMKGHFDLFIFRYAETLLIYAEAKAELGECTQEVLDKTVNKLRDRVDMPHLTTEPSVDPMAIVNGNPCYGYEVKPLLYEIRRERKIELAFEDFRWDDICRWKAGKLVENPKTMLGMVLNADVIKQYTQNNGGVNPFEGVNKKTITDWNGTKELLQPYDVATRTWNDRLYLDPLPMEQTTLNPNLLPQNPGW